MSSTPTLDHQAQAHDAETLRRALATVNAEHAFDRLNPEFGVPADTHDPTGHQAVQQREAALALGTRTAVAIQREEVGPPAWRAGQVAGRARLAARLRHGPERDAPER